MGHLPPMGGRRELEQGERGRASVSHPPHRPRRTPRNQIPPLPGRYPEQTLMYRLPPRLPSRNGGHNSYSTERPAAGFQLTSPMSFGSTRLRTQYPAARKGPPMEFLCGAHFVNAQGYSLAAPH